MTRAPCCSNNVDLHLHLTCVLALTSPTEFVWLSAGMFQYISLQVDLCQKLLFLPQLTHNMTTECSLSYEFSTWKFKAQNMSRTCFAHKVFFVFTSRTIYVHNMFLTCSGLGIFMYWTFNSMNNLLSYCGLLETRISVSEKKLYLEFIKVLRF